jgi:hypothetical protein
MASHPAEARLLWDGGDFDLDPSSPMPEPSRRAKPLLPPGRTCWVDEGGAWCATIGRWSARVICREGASPSWEWQAFSLVGAGPRAVGGRSWQVREDAQRDAENTLAELS